MLPLEVVDAGIGPREDCGSKILELIAEPRKLCEPCELCETSEDSDAKILGSLDDADETVWSLP